MKHLTTFFLIILFNGVAVFNIQGQEKIQGFEVPTKYVSLLLVPDPKCPLQMSGPTKVLGYTNSGFSFGYNLQNKSNANIESFLVEELSWFGGQGYSHPSEVNKNKIFAPLMTNWTLTDEDTAELIPFDEKKAAQSGIFYTSNKIWIVMVVKVKLSDGTTYDVSQKFELLNKFIDTLNLNSTMSAKELGIKEQQLRDFISKLMTSDD